MEADEYEYIFGPDQPMSFDFDDHSSTEEDLND